MLLTLPTDIFNLDWFSIYSVGLKRSLAHIEITPAALVNAVPVSLEALAVELKPEVGTDNGLFLN